MKQSDNTVWHAPQVSREMREGRLGQRSAVLWFTGLSGAGKSTVAHAAEKRLADMGCLTYVFDGDNVRHGLCGDLGFSIEDRKENIRRIGEMVKLFADAGVISLTAFISPLRADRRGVRDLLGDGDFIEVYCRCSLDVCEERDVKGLYQKARAGEIQEFTGISSPYEEPEDPELVLETDRMSIDECVDRIVETLRERGVISEANPKEAASG
ncbi:MAG TPA: adenylyl-sulfate kinase [Gammaproteobacteria bacterium]|nr:adenylyl-sulfate kinase [Gammaproteobacteria bacterium]